MGGINGSLDRVGMLSDFVRGFLVTAVATAAFFSYLARVDLLLSVGGEFIPSSVNALSLPGPIRQLARAITMSLRLREALKYRREEQGENESFYGACRVNYRSEDPENDGGKGSHPVNHTKTLKVYDLENILSIHMFGLLQY